MKELRRTLSFLVKTHHQVWLAQSPLTEACTVGGTSVAFQWDPRELFGSVALERTDQVRQTRQQLSGPLEAGGPEIEVLELLSY